MSNQDLRKCIRFSQGPIANFMFRSVHLKPKPTQNSHHTPSPYLLAFLQGLRELIRGTPQIFSYRLFAWVLVRDLAFLGGAPVSEPAWSHLSSLILLLGNSFKLDSILNGALDIAFHTSKRHMHFFSSLGLYEVFSHTRL